MNTCLAYYGGKQNMINEILPLIPEHDTYCEPFCGGASVFFAKNPSKNECINDIDLRLTNFYKVCKNKFPELNKLIQETLHSEHNHSLAKKMLKEGTGTDVERAWALWVQCNMSFGHRIYGGFAFSEGGQASVTANKIMRFTEEYCHRLRNAEIFERDAVELIKLKDSENMWFFIDPPYVSSDQGHYKGYTKENFIELLDVLANIKGMFLLSSYKEDVLVEYRKKYGWSYKDVLKVLAVDGRREEKKLKCECLSWNYSLDKKQLSLW